MDADGPGDGPGNVPVAQGKGRKVESGGRRAIGRGFESHPVHRTNNHYPMQITISLETVLAILYSIACGVMLGLAITYRRKAKELLAQGKAQSADAKAALEENKKLFERGEVVWRNYPGAVRNQVRDSVFRRTVEEFNTHHPDDLQCLMMLHRTKDGDALNLFHRGWMHSHVDMKAMSYDQGPLHDILRLMVNATAELERQKPGALKVMTVLLDTEREKLNA